MNTLCRIAQHRLFSVFYITYTVFVVPALGISNLVAYYSDGKLLLPWSVLKLLVLVQAALTFLFHAANLEIPKESDYAELLRYLEQPQGGDSSVNQTDGQAD